MKLILCAAAAVLVVSAMPATAQPDAQRGQEIAQKFCAVCHIPQQGAPSLPGAASVPTFAEMAESPGFSADRVAEMMTSPRHPRPPVPLDKDQIADIAAYIATLK